MTQYPTMPTSGARAEHPQATTVLILGIVGFFVPILCFVPWYMGGKAKKELAAGAPYNWGGGLQLGYISGQPTPGFAALRDNRRMVITPQHFNRFAHLALSCGIESAKNFPAQVIQPDFIGLANMHLECFKHSPFKSCRHRSNQVVIEWGGCHGAAFRGSGLPVGQAGSP